MNKIHPPRVDYHQGLTLVENISRYLAEFRAQSLLDIGAGSSYTAQPLSQRVQRYLAVEADVHSVAELRGAGLSVMHGTFPMELPWQFDMVLSSHSVPEDDISKYDDFISKAWELTNSGGVLLIITFKGNRGDLNQIREELLGEAFPSSPEFSCIINTLKRLGGNVQIERVNSYAESLAAADLVKFFESWISGDRAVRERIRDPFTRIIETRYKVKSSMFVFPTEHLFISCIKQ